MKIGVIVPQGWTGEFAGWEATRAWGRTVAVAQQAEKLGFDSIWVFDHLQTAPVPIDEITFESFTSLAALAALTRRIRLGPIVLCAGFRNPALAAKMVSTLDVISEGRAEFGIGAGWKEDEWVSYGYGFPSTSERLAILGDSLEIVRRMLEPGRATYSGRFVSVKGAINVPKGIQQPRIPIMVGGNGQNVTWRLAARFADELNLDGLAPEEVRVALATIRSRCEEIGRDPDTLRVSVHLWPEQAFAEGQERIDRLVAYRELGVSRVMPFVRGVVDTDRALESLAVDALSAGLEL